MKTDYFFLDTWVLSRLTDANFAERLGTFLNRNGYTILVTSLTFVEIYNPGWLDSNGIERMEATARFFGKHPYAIVNPAKVFEAELRSFPHGIREIPTEDLSGVTPKHQTPVLLMFFRRDPEFIAMGKDIQEWTNEYKATKETWLADVDAIIENACRQGHLIQNSKGGFEPLNDSSKEIFLLSLDFRQLVPEDPSSTDLMLKRIQKHGLQRYENCCKAVRFSSLCFWYSYIDVDQSNKIQRKGSDIGDIYHISLMPYCRIFTIDKTMNRVIQRIRAEAKWGKCEVVASDNLRKLLISE